MHPESEHGLRVQLATALRERDAAKDRAQQLNSVALERGRQIAFERERFSETRKELTALRSERDALRAAEADALERAAQIVGEYGSPIANVEHVMSRIRALASPAAAPAAGPVLTDAERDAFYAGLPLPKPAAPAAATPAPRHSAAEEAAMQSYFPPPSEPAPLLPRVLAALEDRGEGCHLTPGRARALAAELRAYIAKAKGEGEVDG